MKRKRISFKASTTILVKMKREKERKKEKRKDPFRSSADVEGRIRILRNKKMNESRN